MVDSIINNRPELLPGFTYKRNNEITGGYSVMLNAEKAGMKLPHHKWVMYCTVHKSYHHQSSFSRSMKELYTPENWCIQCHNEKNLKESNEQSKRTF
jgi:hypothetical protein